MNAVISGTAGQALLIDGESLRSFDVEDPSNLVVRRQADLPYLFGEGRDLRFIENTDLDSVVKELEFESNLSLALDLTLISLDEELEEDIRRDAISDLDELVSVAEVRERLEGIMYARPLPDDGDLAGAMKLCDESRLPKSLGFFEDLNRRQSLISRVSEAWDVIPTQIFGGYDKKSNFQQVVVRQGLLRLLVISLEGGNVISGFLLNAGLDRVIQQLPNYREILQQWSAPFRESGKPQALTRDVDDEFRQETTKKRRHGRLFGLNRTAVLKEVNKRKESISAAMRLRDLVRVQELVHDLVRYQRENGEIEYAAKSLCDLAMEAKELGMFSLQLELTERSINVAPDDGWSWAQYADALLNMRELDAALDAYSQAAAFGAGAIAKRGRGEVLKAKSQLDEALAAFDEVIADDAQDLVAKTGRAEVLKAKGLFDESLAAFDEVISQNLENAVAKTGRAEVLKAQGRLNDALSAFDEVIRQHPENVVAKTGRAEVLKAQGRLNDALSAFDEVIRQHPENAVAKSGRAEVLKAQGRLNDALSAFDEVIRRHPENAVAKTGRAEVLKGQGRLNDALSAFDEVIRQHPEHVVAKSGRAEVLKAQGRLNDALSAFDEVIRQHPENVVAKTGRAEVLKAKGLFDESLAAFDEVIQQHPENAVAKTGRAEVLKAKGLFDESLAAFDEVIAHHPEHVVAKTGRAEVLKAQGRLNDALAAFDEVIRQHPENAVAKTGRAEVLKAQGRLNDALSAFDEVIRQHPEDAVAKTGLVTILVANRRYEEALMHLGMKEPVTLSDWIDYHILGMIQLRTGKVVEAMRIFDDGVRNNPWPSSREYFSRALALAWLRGRDFQKASQALETVRSPLLQPIANVLRIHAFGAQGKTARASIAYESLSASPRLRSNDLTRELHSQFILKKPPRKTEEWILDREAEIILLAA